MLSRLEAVAVARRWKGTPYVLRARLRGSGCDCCTLLAEYLIEIGAAEATALETLGYYSSDWFCHTPSDRYLVGLRQFGTEVAKGMCHGGLKARPGDLALFKVARSRVYNHGAIVTEWPRGVHAQREGVREADLSRHHLTAYHEAAIFNPWGDEE